MGRRVVISSITGLAGLAGLAGWATGAAGATGSVGSRPGLLRSMSSIRDRGKSNGVWKAEKASKVLGRGWGLAAKDRGASTGRVAGTGTGLALGAGLEVGAKRAAEGRAAGTGGAGVLARGRGVTGCLRS